MKNKSQIILGIDPGYGITGFGIIEITQKTQKVLTYGVIRTPAKMEFVERLKMLSEDLNDLIKKYKPTIAGVEKLYFAKNAKTAMDVGQARGVILLSLIKASIEIIELTPLQVKQGITGYGKAEKRQVQEMVKRMLNLKTIPQPDDAADALAVAITVSSSQKYLKLAK
jgi:crossover junction endodeoxyribonuclease RuvC